MSDGITVAVVDSGVNVPHPHPPAVCGGICIDLEGNEGGDFVDVLGHGTAVAAAIHEKAAGAEIYAVKAFGRELATTVGALVKAIDWASARHIRLVNLSLGTTLEFRAVELEPAVRRAVRAGSIVVSAFEFDGRPCYPGQMEDVVGVCVDEELPREQVDVISRGGRLLLGASPYPRPIPGIPRERNLSGISFAVANATGCLAAALVGHREVHSAATALELLQARLR